MTRLKDWQIKQIDERKSSNRKEQRDKILKTRKFRQNINFLEKPIWLPIKKQGDDLNADPSVSYDDGTGYILTSEKYGFPTQSDIHWLYYMMFRIHNAREIDKTCSTVRITSIAEVFRDLGLPFTSVYYDKFKASLKLWGSTKLAFTKSFYDGNSQHKISKVFSVVIGSASCVSEVKSELKDNIWPENEDHLDYLDIRFDPEFVNANYDKYSIDIVLLFMLKLKPLSCRLYQLLYKSFYGADNFQIGSLKLEMKLGRKFQSPSHMLREIEIALDEIQKVTSLNVTVMRTNDIYTFIKCDKVLL